MRNLRLAFPLLLAAMALGSSAQSQTDNPDASPDASNELPSAVADARCQYTAGDNACAGGSESAKTRRSASVQTTLAQLPRRIPGPPFRTGRPQVGRAAYPGMWRSAGSPAHAIIGTLIGFGL